MKKSVIKALPVFFVILVFVTLGLVSVSAAVRYTNSQGSVRLVCGKYKKTFTAKRYKNNFSKALETALETARKKASDNKKARVTISKGHYKLDRTIKVYSNTTLVATGSYFRYYGNLLRNGFDKLKKSGKGYTSAKNITIKGGEWEQLIDFKYAASDDSTKWHSTFRFAHCYNIKVKEADFRNNYNCHDIEIAGVKNSEFYKNCFYNTKSVNGIANSGGRESFQIDVNTSSAMPYFPQYDKTPCVNINIHHNIFRNKFRAVGSHHAVIGKTYDNINVHHNIMDNIAGISVYAVYWTNSKVYSNTMTNVGFGVDLRSMINSSSLNFYNLDKLSYQDSESFSQNSKTYIYGNTINIRKSKNIISSTCGIRALGDYYASDNKTTGTKKGIYRIYNVNIGVDPSGASMPNTLSGNLSTGIKINYGENCLIKNNIIDLKDSPVNNCKAVELSKCSNAAVLSNTLTSKGFGVAVYGDCLVTEITGNRINCDDECIYYNGASSSDKDVLKYLTVTDNVLDCPEGKAAVRVVYDKVNASIYLNSRTDGAVALYRLKGDNQTKYHKQQGDISLENLTLTSDEGVNVLSWNSLSEPDGYYVYSDGMFIGDIRDTRCVLDNYDGQNITVIPYRVYGNIIYTGVPMYVSA